VDKLTKNIGFGMGLEFRDSSMVLNAKNTHTVKSSMVFNVCVAVSGLDNPAASSDKGRTYALQVRGLRRGCLTRGVLWLYRQQQGQRL
jgi:nucleosome binding factor SPN SPT16 subunit